MLIGVPNDIVHWRFCCYY